MIYYGRQSINDEDVDAVVRALKSDFLTQGPIVTKFEESVAGYCGAKYAAAVCNGSIALYLACRALELQPGDWLWTSPNSFIASANCALYCGAQVDFVDIEIDSGNMDVHRLEEKLVKAEAEGRLPKIVIPVHFAGYSADMQRINQLARKYGFYIIEDACHALGGEYQNRKIGSCHYSDITVFSFHPVKSITAGEGGMLLCNSEALATRIRLLAGNGITRELDTDNPNYRSWHYEQRELGINARLTDIHAALGLSQFGRLDEMIEKRSRLAGLYKENLITASVGLLVQRQDRESAWHLFCIQAGTNRDELYGQLLEQGVTANVHYIPIHLQPYYQSLGFAPGNFPNAEAFYNSVLTLPLYYDLRDDDVVHICNVIRGCINRAA